MTDTKKKSPASAKKKTPPAAAKKAPPKPERLGKEGKAELKRLAAATGGRADSKVLELTASIYEEMTIAKLELDREGRTVVMVKGGVDHIQNSPAYKRWSDTTKQYRQLLGDLCLLAPAEEDEEEEQFM